MNSINQGIIWTYSNDDEAFEILENTLNKLNFNIKICNKEEIKEEDTCKIDIDTFMIECDEGNIELTKTLI
jgi:hypothetical protein